MPREDDRPGSWEALQGLPLPWGKKAYPWLHLVGAGSLYSTPGVSYTKLVVPAQKSESEMKNLRTTWGPRPKWALSCDNISTNWWPPVTEAGWGGSNTSALSSPWEHGCGCGWCAGNSSSWPNSDWEGGPTQSAQPAVFWERMLAVITVSGEMEVQMGTKDQVWGVMVQPTMETHFCSSATNARDGATWPESALHQHPL